MAEVAKGKEGKVKEGKQKGKEKGKEKAGGVGNVAFKIEGAVGPQKSVPAKTVQALQREHAIHERHAGVIHVPCVVFCMPPTMLLEAFAAFCACRFPASGHAPTGHLCVFRVLKVLEPGLAEYGVTLRRPGKHYRVCLSADASGRKDAAVATLLRSQVRPTAAQGLLACGVKNAQSASAAPEHLDRVYRTSGHLAATDGILKGISVCTGCVEAPERPPNSLGGTEPSGPELHGVPLAVLKWQHPLGERRRPPPSLASQAAEDLVDMSTDDLKERYKRTVTMAGLMAYTLTEDREEELPVTGAWTMIKKRELASLRVCCVIYVTYVHFFCLPLRLWSCSRLFSAFAASSTFPQSCFRMCLQG